MGFISIVSNTLTKAVTFIESFRQHPLSPKEILRILVDEKNRAEYLVQVIGEDKTRIPDSVVTGMVPSEPFSITRLLLRGEVNSLHSTADLLSASVLQFPPEPRARMRLFAARLRNYYASRLKTHEQSLDTTGAELTEYRAKFGGDKLPPLIETILDMLVHDLDEERGLISDIVTLEQDLSKYI